MRKPIRPKNAQIFLYHNKQLQALIQKSQQNTQLLNFVKTLCPKKLSQHLLFAQQKQHHLILMTDSPTWASQLHFLAPRLLKKLSAQRYFFNKIIVKVSLQKEREQIVNKPRTIKKFSKETAKIIQQTAEIIDHPQLKKALMALSQHHS